MNAALLDEMRARAERYSEWVRDLTEKLEIARRGLAEAQDAVARLEQPYAQEKDK